jgi:MoxR-like ATPase
MSSQVRTSQQRSPARPRASAIFDALHKNVERVVRGKSEATRLAVACLCAEGHLLIEDRPGTGKTSLAKALAASISGIAKRVQFTPDLLPSDITGVTIYNPQASEFSFRPGPVFTNILVADEINRASPKTQAALLEVMEERQVTADGVSRPVPRPFMVVATQNPMDFDGTYPLPEVQLDRFAMKINVGYADEATEIEIMARPPGIDPVSKLEPVVDADSFGELVRRIRSVTVSAALRDYVARIVTRTRHHPDLRLGVSTRGTLTLLAIAKSYAVGDGRSYVIPDDIKRLLEPVLSHRLAVTPEAELDGLHAADVLAEVVGGVEVPRDRPEVAPADGAGR